jgi:hypothetical protein
VVREIHEEFGSETAGTSFVGNTVHAYDHHTLALLVDTAVYRSGTFVLHVHAASRWAAVAGLHTSAGHSNDSSVARH